MRRGARILRAGAARTLGGALLLAASLLAAPLPDARAGTPPTRPFLRIAAGGPVGAVPRLSVDASGRLLAAASYDKTVRLFSLPDGRQRAVLRLPIGPGHEGEVYAVALTPDGRRVFAAGATGGSWDGTFSIYLFSVRRARLIGRLPGLPSPVNDLAVSPDGTRFAAGLARGGVREWDAKTGKPIAQDADYAGPVRRVLFDARNRLFVSAADGKLRVYDAAGKRIAERAPEPGLHPWGLALSPDGSLLAVTFDTPDKAGHLHVDVLAASTLARVFTPDTSGLAGEGLLAVTWAATADGGVRLLAGGYAHTKAGDVIREWKDFGLGPATDLTASRDTVLDLRAVPGGGAVYSAEDPGWGRIGADGAVVARPAPPLADLRPARQAGGLAVSADGTTVAFATGNGRFRFDAATGRLARDPAPDPALAVARTAAPGLVVTDWRDTDAPRLNGRPLALDPAEYSRSLALLPQGAGVLLGTDTHLRLYGPHGRERAKLSLPAAAWAVTVNATGSVAVAALLDGTIRWYGLSASAITPRVALFAHADGTRWVLFTPDGFFDESDRGGDDLVGVLLDRGADAPPVWVSFGQAYRPLYAPDVVRAALAGNVAPARARLAALGDLRARFAAQPGVRIAAACIETASGCTPIDPAAGTARLPDGATALRLSLRLTDHGRGLGNIDTFVNGRNVGRHKPPVAQADSGGTDRGAKAVTARVVVPLDPGRDAVRLRVYDRSDSVYAEAPPLALAGGPAAAASGGRLFVLAIGIDHFAAPSLTLHSAVSDARNFAALAAEAGKPVFGSEHVTLLTDQQATRAGILAAFAALAREVRPDDTFLFYVATHGARAHENGRFLLIPADESDLSSWRAVARQAIGETTLVAALARIRARDALLFLDTCYSGAVTADALANVGHETGRYLIAASTSVQEALDTYDGKHGLMIYALRQAFDGGAPHGANGVIGALSLGEYLSERIGVLARRKGHAQDAVFKTAQEDLRSFPVGEVIAPAGR